MKERYKIAIAIILCISLLLGGCLNMKKSEDKEKTPKERNAGNSKMNDYEKENYVPVQEYTGEGYTLRDSNPKTGEIAEENREEVVDAVEHYFLEEYKTEVKVHNIVSASDAVSVFVESIGQPHFYSFAIVGIDIKNKEVKKDSVWSQEGQVEYAIGGGLYAMAFEEEFRVLDEYFNKLVVEYPVVETRTEAIENVAGNGHRTPHYYISVFDDVFDDLLDIYLDNPNITNEELKAFFDANPFEAKYLIVSVDLFMKSVNAEPDEDIYDEIYTDIKEIEGIPRGEYHISLNDNYIDRRRGNGDKKNSLDKTQANGILKE